MARKKVKFDVNPLLSGPSLASRATAGNPYRELSLSEIDLDPEQPRRVFREESIEELAQSIQEFGVLSPLLVQLTEGGTYKLVAGERRYRAAKKAGLKVVPALVVARDSDDSTLARQLTENLQREDLSPMERALAIGQLKESFTWSIREIAKRLGISKAMVQRSLEILSLPDDLQAALIAGSSESKVLLLGVVADRAVRKQLIGRLEELTRAQLEAEIAKAQGEEPGVYHRGTEGKRKKEQRTAAPQDTRIIEDIQRNLATRVQISRKRGKREQGKISLEFYSDADLDEIYRRLMSS